MDWEVIELTEDTMQKLSQNKQIDVRPMTKFFIEIKVQKPDFENAKNIIFMENRHQKMFEDVSIKKTLVSKMGFRPEKNDVFRAKEDLKSAEKIEKIQEEENYKEAETKDKHFKRKSFFEPKLDNFENEDRYNLKGRVFVN